MAFNYVNFRSTSGFVTDAAGDSYSLGSTTNAPSVGGLYPTVWSGDRTASAEDIGGAPSPHCSGIVSSTGFDNISFLNLVPGRTYNFKMLIGKYNVGSTLNLGYGALQANNATATIVTPGGSVTSVNTNGVVAGHFIDADGTDYASYAAWAADDNGSTVSITATGTAIRFERSSNAPYWSTIGIEDPTLSVASLSNRTLLGAGS